jgi:hypothetical protein
LKRRELCVSQSGADKTSSFLWYYITLTGKYAHTFGEYSCLPLLLKFCPDFAALAVYQLAERSILKQ